MSRAPRTSSSTGTSIARACDGFAEFTVADAGSVGSPYDGDPRASYVLIDGDSIDVVRLEYDIERERAMLESSGYPDAQRIAETRRTGRFIPIADLESHRRKDCPGPHRPR